MTEPTTSAADVGSALRSAALRIIQAADDLVEWFRHPPEDEPGVTFEADTPDTEETDEGDR